MHQARMQFRYIIILLYVSHAQIVNSKQIDLKTLCKDDVTQINHQKCKKNTITQEHSDIIAMACNTNTSCFISAMCADIACHQWLSVMQDARERCSLACNLWLKAFPTSKFLKMHGNGQGNARSRFLIVQLFALRNTRLISGLK